MQTDPDEHSHFYLKTRLESCSIYCHHMNRIRPLISRALKNPNIIMGFSMGELKILEKHYEEKKEKAFHSFEIATSQFAAITNEIMKRKGIVKESLF